MAHSTYTLINHEAVAAVLKSPEGLADIAARCARMAAAAGDDCGGVFGSDAIVGQNRIHGMVWCDDQKARIGEATQRSLTRAIDAGR